MRGTQKGTALHMKFEFKVSKLRARGAVQRFRYSLPIFGAVSGLMQG